MRRILLFLLVVTGSLLISSCLTIEERITLNADGSGTQTNTVDFSELLSNPMIKMGLAEKMAEGGEDVPLKMDSTFNIIDDLGPINPQWTAEQRAMVARVKSEMKMDIEEGIGLVTTNFAFTDPIEISQLAELLASSNKAEGKDDNPFAGMSGQDFLLSTITLKGTKMMRSTVQSPDFENPMAETGLEDGMADMMKEMFGDAVISYRVDFPGKVKKVKGFPGHEIDGNSLIMLFDFNEMLEDPGVMARALSGEVKFKK